MAKIVAKIEKIELPTEEFFKKFKNYSEYFEQEETILEDDENGVWIHAIIPNNNTSTKNTLFVQSWDYGSSDPKCFVYFGEQIYIGTCECSLNPNQLLSNFVKLLKR